MLKLPYRVNFELVRVVSGRFRSGCQLTNQVIGTEMRALAFSEDYLIVQTLGPVHKISC